MRRTLNLIHHRVALLLSAALLTCHCGRLEDFTQIEPEPALLLGGLESYSSPGAVAIALGKPEWRVIEQSTLAPEDKRPPFAILSVVVSPYEDRGQAGELHLTFFNARLMETAFFPSDPQAFRTTLGPFPLGDGSCESRPGHVRVFSAVNYQDREYFQWEDERLAKQEERWLRKYA